MEALFIYFPFVVGGRYAHGAEFHPQVLSLKNKPGKINATCEFSQTFEKIANLFLKIYGCS
jgi:hypothetical protein